MPTFNTLLHADFSTHPAKRWCATATRTPSGWHVSTPRPVQTTTAFVTGLWAHTAPVLAGFDFPMGLPIAYARRTALQDFPAALTTFGSGLWSSFFRVAETAADISLTRPFYPRVSTAAARQHHLLSGLGVDTINTLRRQCELATAIRRAACPLFWTLGANQVGKAAIAGWQEIIIPAMARGARLWPFHGDLATLAKSGAPILAETYPAEAYAHTGMQFPPGHSKRNPAHRRAAMHNLSAWARHANVTFSPGLAEQIHAGFGSHPTGEDAFDAFAGLLGMIEVADNRRAAGPPMPDSTSRWEGWILGQE